MTKRDRNDSVRSFNEAMTKNSRLIKKFQNLLFESRARRGAAVYTTIGTSSTSFTITSVI